MGLPARLSFLLLVLAASAGLRAQPAPVVATPGFGSIDLLAHLELLEDPEGRLDLASVMASTGFTGMPARGGNFGFSGSTWWVRFAVHNPGGERIELLLRQDYPLIDDLRAHIGDGAGGFRTIATGDQVPFERRELDLRNFVFGVSVPAGATVPVYLRFATTGTMDISLHLHEPAALFGLVGVEQLAYGMYYGGFLALIVYNLFIFIAVRDRVFFWYLLYAVVFGLHFAVHNGFAFQFLWPAQPTWANQSLVVLLGLSLVFALQFTRGFLDAARVTPRMDKAAIVLQALAMAIVLGSFVLPYARVIVPIAVVTALVTGLILAMGTWAMAKGYRPARYFMLAWAAMLFTVFAYMLKAFGLLPHNTFTQNGFQIGSLLEMTLLSVALAARVRDLQRHSFSDPLTNLLNRRSFDQHLELEFIRATRNRTPVSLLMVDIDHFKRFNDQHGHAAGDQAIQAVAKQLRRSVRQGDVVCRYGGEEFAAILPGASCPDAAMVAEKIRASVAQVRVAGQSLSVSVGVACSVDAPYEDADELFRTADEALYEAKASGRDRVVQHGKRQAAPRPGTVAEGPPQ
ncbi:MAG: diguanylate cyclase [Pseudoxanthomonas sp.]|nr:diguanylate cyclase [Pseudoxanthomonas sp.]